MPTMPVDHLPRKDAPVFDPKEDWLDRSKFLKSALRVVAYGPAPLVCGVEGDWGSGKTSILHQAYYTLEGECPQNPGYDAKAPKVAAGNEEKFDHVRTIWFEAWRYQHEPAPVVALLHEMRAQLSTGQKFSRQIKKIGETAVRGAFEMIGDVAKGIMVALGAPGAAAVPAPKVGSTIQGIGESIEARRFDTPLQSVQIRKHLTTAIETLLPARAKATKDVPDPPAPRMVVMIDDLDRCEPESAFRLLEGIKIYLDLPNCIFLLGINRREIESAIRVVLGKQAPGHDEKEMRYRAHEYVEKLCPVLWRLPAPTLEEKRNFADKCWDEATEIWTSVMRDTLSRFDALPSNPRKIVALCNRVSQLIQAVDDGPSKLTDKTAQDQAYKLIFSLACLYQFHPSVYRILQGGPRFFSEIKRWCVNPEAKDLHECFMSITKAQAADGDPTSPTPGSGARFKDLFIDPIRSDIFRIQCLIRDLNPIESELEKLLAI